MAVSSRVSPPPCVVDGRASGWRAVRFDFQHDLPQHAPPAREPRLDGRLGHVEHVGDLPLRQSLRRLQEQRLGVLRGQPRKQRERLACPALGRPWRIGIGWAVAAVIALAWISQSVLPRTQQPARESVAGFNGFQGFATADDAFDAYVDKARSDGMIYGDVAPPAIIGSRELGGGEGFEILVVRQIVERRRVPELYKLVPVDETGALAPVVIRPRTEEIR